MHLGLMFCSLCYYGIVGVDGNERRRQPMRRSPTGVSAWRHGGSDDGVQGSIECGAIPTVAAGFI